MLLVGHSTGHVNVVIKNGATHVMLFTTEECMDIARSLSEELDDAGVNVLDLCKLDPFSEDSVSVMAESISECCDDVIRNGGVPVIGLTGGTNLMVAAMCLVATRKKLRCHYVSKGSDDPLPIDLSSAFARIGGVA